MGHKVKLTLGQLEPHFNLELFFYFINNGMISGLVASKELYSMHSLAGNGCQLEIS